MFLGSSARTHTAVHDMHLEVKAFFLQPAHAHLGKLLPHSQQVSPCTGDPLLFSRQQGSSSITVVLSPATSQTVNQIERCNSYTYTLHERKLTMVHGCKSVCFLQKRQTLHIQTAFANHSSIIIFHLHHLHLFPSSPIITLICPT